MGCALTGGVPAENYRHTTRNSIGVAHGRGNYSSTHRRMCRCEWGPFSASAESDSKRGARRRWGGLRRRWVRPVLVPRSRRGILRILRCRARCGHEWPCGAALSVPGSPAFLCSQGRNCTLGPAVAVRVGRLAQCPGGCRLVGWRVIHSLWSLAPPVEANRVFSAPGSNCSARLAGAPSALQWRFRVVPTGRIVA